MFVVMYEQTQKTVSLIVALTSSDFWATAAGLSNDINI